MKATKMEIYVKHGYEKSIISFHDTINVNYFLSAEVFLLSGMLVRKIR